MGDKTDILIIGGGLAGCILHNELSDRGFTVELIDKAKENKSSRVAAGIVNPITGKYFSLSWRSSEFFPELSSYYQNIEKKLSSSFFHGLPLLRILNTPGDENTWLSKKVREEYKEFIGSNEYDFPVVKQAIALLEIEHSGYLDTTVFMDAYHHHLAAQDLYFDHEFNSEYLEADTKSYRGKSYDHIIFCEGYRATSNPYFNYLPFRPNKGELLEIYSEELPEDVILNGSVFILPVGNKKFKVGATYDHFDLSDSITEKRKSELIQRFEKTVYVDYEVTDHWYGIRPAVLDRRPLLGEHPQHKGLWIFNGMGSKAASMAPVLATELVNSILHNAPLHPEADIIRYKPA
ncbi:FAD-binding oxidoreductase [bacterium]|nr:FAD-binding oxidoreductase [bacterium]